MTAAIGCAVRAVAEAASCVVTVASVGVVSLLSSSVVCRRARGRCGGCARNSVGRWAVALRMRLASPANWRRLPQAVALASAAFAVWSGSVVVELSVAVASHSSSSRCLAHSRLARPDCGRLAASLALVCRDSGLVSECIRCGGVAVRGDRSRSRNLRMWRGLGCRGRTGRLGIAARCCVDDGGKRVAAGVRGILRPSGGCCCGRGARALLRRGCCDAILHCNAP